MFSPTFLFVGTLDSVFCELTYIYFYKIIMGMREHPHYHDY